MSGIPKTSFLRCGLHAVRMVAIIHLAFCYVHASPTVAVATIEQTPITDLVLLNRGFDAGLRQGMLCRISREGTEIAEVLLVELRPVCSAALIVSVAPKQTIRVGDVASIKVLKS